MLAFLSNFRNIKQLVLRFRSFLAAKSIYYFSNVMLGIHTSWDIFQCTSVT